MGTTRKPPYDPDIAARLERFRSTIEAKGGPIDAIERGRSGLTELWTWIDQAHKPLAQPLDDEALRRAGPLPGWSLRRFTRAKGLGPELTWLLDGLAAHVTNIVLDAEPAATWSVAHDAYLGRVPTMQLPGRTRVPMDDVIIELIGVLQGARSHIELDSLESLVDYVLAYGDPRPMSYESQTAKEASALLELIAGGSEARLNAFLDAVEAAGGPRARLDFSAASLVPLWAWLTSRPLPSTPIADVEMRKHELPWWYAFSGRLVGQTLGPELCWLATGAADYFAAMVFRELPGSAWRLGSERIGADFREPLLRFEGDGEFDIHDQMARYIKSFHERDARTQGPNVLRALFEQRLTWARKPPEPPAPPEPAYAVSHGAPSTNFGRLRNRMARSLGVGPTSTAVIMFSDAVAHLEDGRIDRFARMLAKQDRVERARREDREVVSVVAPYMSAGDLEATVDRVWLETARRPRR